MSSILEGQSRRPAKNSTVTPVPAATVILDRSNLAKQNHPWRGALGLTLLAIALLLAIYHETAWSMVAIWIRSETFAHGFLILPMSLWMMHTKRAALLQLRPRPCWPVLILLAGAGLVWLIGQSAGVQALGQSALVAMLILLVWVILGTAVFKAILFPLAFLFFMVPMGDFLMTPLIDHTANFVVSALQMTGVPVYREGNQFAIPNGNWSVVEACSGLRYLIASITLGCLFAYLSYRTLWRRAAFILASVLVPIVANWVRAYLIVMLGYLSSNKLATGVDHIIYGWVFFGLVMLLLFWVGSIWREDVDVKVDPKLASEPEPFAQAKVTLVQTSAMHLLPVAVAALAVLLVWHPALSALEQVSPEAAPQLTAITKLSNGGWQVSDEPGTTWVPHYQQPRALLSQTFKQQDTTASPAVSLFIAYYNRQNQYEKVVSYTNQIVMISDKVWSNVGERQIDLELGGKTTSVTEAQVRGPERLLAWRWYWINGWLTDNDYVAKALIALNMLAGRGDEGAVILVYTHADEFKTEAASERLRQFVGSAWPSIVQRLESATHGSTNDSGS